MSAIARPFYGEFAWAYDLLIDRPVAKECAAITTWLDERRVYPGSTVLDAGCGTGRYATELARRGYVVHGIDAAPEMIRVAESVGPTISEYLHFDVCDIRSLGGVRYDAVLCRGVLNDPDGRPGTAPFSDFATSLRDGGVVVAEVREWEQTAARKRVEPLFRKRVQTERGLLTFTSVTTLDEANHSLVVAENHTLEGDDGESSCDFTFVMRCWTRNELLDALGSAGFIDVSLFGAYDPAVPVGATDRIVAVATGSHVEQGDTRRLGTTRE